MPNLVRLDALRSKIMNRTDTADEYATPAIVNGMINDSIRDLIDEVWAVSRMYLVKNPPSSISVVSGTGLYSLPADFVHAIRVEVQYSATDWRQLFPLGTFSEKSEFVSVPDQNLWAEWDVFDDQLLLAPTPNWAGTVRVWYNYNHSDLSADADTFDFIHGWDRYVVADVLAMIAEKEESDQTPLHYAEGTSTDQHSRHRQEAAQRCAADARHASTAPPSSPSVGASVGAGADQTPEKDCE